MTKQAQAALLKQLKNPFDPKFVKFRVGATNKDKTKGIALAYIDSREVMKRLDDVCGVGGWQDKYIPVDGGFICELSILIDGHWVTKSNAAGNTKVEAIKGGASDALKRAAATWGVGRYLYYLPNAWVPLKQVGNSYVLAEVPELPDWALPDKNIERWEDIAELEADKNSGADDIDPVDPDAGNAREAGKAEKKREAIDVLMTAKDLDDLKITFMGLGNLVSDTDVIAAKDKRKQELTNASPTV